MYDKVEEFTGEKKKLLDQLELHEDRFTKYQKDIDLARQRLIKHIEDNKIL